MKTKIVTLLFITCFAIANDKKPNKENRTHMIKAYFNGNQIHCNNDLVSHIVWLTRGFTINEINSLLKDINKKKSNRRQEYFIEKKEFETSIEALNLPKRNFFERNADKILYEIKDFIKICVCIHLVKSFVAYIKEESK